MSAGLGTPAERNLLGAVLVDPNEFALVGALVDGECFSDPSMGWVFDMLGREHALDHRVTRDNVHLRFPEWDVHLPSTIAYEWIGAGMRATRAPEYAEQVREAYDRRRVRDIAQRFRETADDASIRPVELATDVKRELERVVDTTAGGELVARGVDEIRSTVDSHDWVIPNFLERRDRMIVTGFEGGGKTTFVRQVVASAAAGIRPLVPRERMRPLRSLVIDVENSYRQWRRAMNHLSPILTSVYGGADPDPMIRVVCEENLDLTKGRDLGRVHRLIDREKPDIVQIGPLYRLVPRAIQTDDDAAPLIVALDSLRDRGVALLMEAHAGKSTDVSGDRNLAPRGSSALLGWPEFGFGLRPLATDPDMAAWAKWRGDRDYRPFPKHLRRGTMTELPWMDADVPAV